MSKEELKTEINKVLEHFSDKALEDLLLFLKNIEQKQPKALLDKDTLTRILQEDDGLLRRLAQ